MQIRRRSDADQMQIRCRSDADLVRNGLRKSTKKEVFQKIVLSRAMSLHSNLQLLSGSL
jgi:hypothetical protein